MSDTQDHQLNRRQFLTVGLALASGVVTLRPRPSLADAQANRQDIARWAFLSDTHIATDPDHRFRGFYPYRNLQEVTAQIAANLPDGLVVTGDLARSRGQTGAYDNVKALLAPIAAKRPVHLAVGNHDHRGRFLSAFADGDGQGVQNKHVVTAGAGPVRLVILDSLLYVNMFPGMLGRVQRVWLDTFLRICDDTPIILFLHHTPRADLLDNRRLFDIIGPARKVKAVVFGHSHKYDFVESEGIQLINLPATGYNFTSGQPVGWVEARLTDKGGEFTLHAVGGNTWRNGSTTALKWRT